MNKPQPLNDKYVDFFNEDGTDYERTYRNEDIKSAVEWFEKEIDNVPLTTLTDNQEAIKIIIKAIMKKAFEDVMKNAE